MHKESWKAYFCGLGAYAVCIVPAILPIFHPSLDLGAALRLGLAATLASVLVVLVRVTDFDMRIGDPGAKFTQALLGIAVCAGAYALLAPVSHPQITQMSLLWIAISMTSLSPRKVLALSVFYIGIYLNAYSDNLLEASDPLRPNAIYALLVSSALIAFMYQRAYDYASSNQEKAELRDDNTRQAAELAEARERIHALTRQDLDTIALKFPFFKEELGLCKERADASHTTFSTGLIEIDHLDSIKQRYGETVVKQLLREVVERVTGVMGEMGLKALDDGSYHPLGRVGEGLYGIILPHVNLKRGLACVKQMHKVVELQSIPTMAGKLNVTLTIGIAEYFPGETLDEIMEMVGIALETARMSNMEELQNSLRAKQQLAPVKAATGLKDLRVLHYKEYEAPLH